MNNQFQQYLRLNMSEREEMLKTYLKNQFIVHQRLLAAGVSYLTEEHIWQILQSELHLEYSEVIHARLSAEQMLEIILSFIKNNGKAIAKVEFDFDETDIKWIPVTSDDLKKATVRHDGNIWVIHQDDPDPKPSIPHAHNYRGNLKLDLYTGDLFRKTQYVGKLKENVLHELVEKIKIGCPNIKFQS